MTSAPEGRGDDIAKIAFSVGIKKVSRQQVESQHTDGKIEKKDVIDIETSTPQGKLEQKGKLEEGKDADLLVLSKENLEIKDVVANGRRLMKSGKLSFKEKFLEESNRHIELDGKKKK